MAVALKQENIITEVGAHGVIHSWFSTVAVRLEDGKWGSKYPNIMNNLYQGKLENSQGKAALKELLEISGHLAEIPTSKIVWDAENLALYPPLEHQQNQRASSVANYYLTANGLNLTQEFVGNVESMIEFGGSLEIISINLPPPKRR